MFDIKNIWVNACTYTKRIRINAENLPMALIPSLVFLFITTILTQSLLPVADDAIIKVEKLQLADCNGNKIHPDDRQNCIDIFNNKTQAINDINNTATIVKLLPIVFSISIFIMSLKVLNDDKNDNK